jgi:hypothetical protein
VSGRLTPGIRRAWPDAACASRASIIFRSRRTNENITGRSSVPRRPSVTERPRAVKRQFVRTNYAYSSDVAFTPSVTPAARPRALLCVPKIRFCNIDCEGRQGQVVRRRRQALNGAIERGVLVQRSMGPRHIIIDNRRHIRVGFGGRRRSTLTCCRRTRFSASSVALALKREAGISRITRISRIS